MAFSFTQLCRQCKEDFKTFKIELSCYEEESGKCCLSNNEIFENFSFVCRSCGLMNILDFDKLCNKETVLYLKKGEKLNKRIEETINNLIQIKIEKLIITTSLNSLFL